MASAFSHTVLAFTLGKALQYPMFTWPVLCLGMACSVVPDLDVIGFYLGVQYGDLWGHRGMTHSLFFAGLLSAILTGVWYRQKSTAARACLFFYLFICTASHAVLDALTDGGLGVAFFSPFDTTRYFFAARPVAVSPIGIGAFFNEEAFHVLASEVTWIWLPTIAGFLLIRGLQYVWSAQRTEKQAPED
jgi:inner membrane protein